MLFFQTVVRPNKAELLCRRLIEWGRVQDLSASEVLGAGIRYRPDGGNNAGSTFEYLPKVVISGAIIEAEQEELIELVCGLARTGRRGDGKIWFIATD